MARRRTGFWYGLAIGIAKPWLLLLTRRRWVGLERVPPAGTGVIVAANHLSHLDPFPLAHALYDGAGRLPRFLAKHTLFALPVAGRILTGARQIPVRRSTTDASKALEGAVDALQEGRCVLIYPEGTTTKRADYWPGPAKTGVARLALLSGAPVLPVAHWGSRHVFGQDRKLHLRRVDVEVRVGPPVDLTAYLGQPMSTEVLHGATAAIMAAIDGLLAEVRHDQPPADLVRPA